MTGTLHLLLGRLAAAVLILLAATGAILAVDAIAGTASNPTRFGGLSVAGFVDRLARHGTLEMLAVTPSGTIVAQFESPRLRAEVDPGTGELRPLRPQGELARIATDLHRSLGLGGIGRFVLAAATIVALVLAFTGVVMCRGAPRRTGGASALHRRVGIAILAPLSVSAVTGLGLSVAAFFPAAIDGIRPPVPAFTAEGARRPAADLDVLKAVALGDLEELVLPRVDDPADTYQLTTVDAFLDLEPVTGIVVARRERPTLHRLATTLLRLHAGYGRPLLAAILGLTAVAYGFVVTSGLWLHFRRSSARRRAASGASADSATGSTVPR